MLCLSSRHRHRVCFPKTGASLDIGKEKSHRRSDRSRFRHLRLTPCERAYPKSASTEQQFLHGRGVDVGFGDQIVDIACFVGAVGILAARSEADGVDTGLAIEAAVRGASPGDKELRLDSQLV